MINSFSDFVTLIGALVIVFAVVFVWVLWGIMLGSWLVKLLGDVAAIPAAIAYVVVTIILFALIVN